ncbi:MAG: hypothetical protein NTY95_07840 [Bacteroidia bacterium]|nr:hypothetical protein [Bacteroidia bacterium]
MFIKIGNLKQSDYKGIPEMAAYRLHSDIFEMLKPYLKEKLHILDFGCGQGAFSQRLVDLGMVVDACDINTDQLKANVNWKYLDDCLKLLKKGGIIVLTTPNISNFISRLRFFMRGSLLAYEKTDLKHGHITPLSFVQIENLCDHFKLEILKKGHVGPIPLIHIYELSRFSLLRNTVLPLLYPFMSGPKKGRALIYILRKNE